MDFSFGGGGSGSYERPKPGTYHGVLIGVAAGGTHEGTYGARNRLLLRWELHRRKGPSLDAEGHIHTVTCPYNATLNEKSTLFPVVEAHLGAGALQGRGTTSSRDWLGKAARLVLVDDGANHVNVAAVSALDPEEDQVPTQVSESEHWEVEDGRRGTSPPRWAEWLVRKSREWPELEAALGGGPGAAPASPRPQAPAAGYGVPPRTATLDPRFAHLTVAAAPDRDAENDDIPF